MNVFQEAGSCSSTKMSDLQHYSPKNIQEWERLIEETPRNFLPSEEAYRLVPIPQMVVAWNEKHYLLYFVKEGNAFEKPVQLENESEKELNVVVLGERNEETVLQLYLQLLLRSRVKHSLSDIGSTKTRAAPDAVFECCGSICYYCRGIVRVGYNVA